MSEWRSHMSARGNREHWIWITPAREKLKHFRMMERVRARSTPDVALERKHASAQQIAADEMRAARADFAIVLQKHR